MFTILFKAVKKVVFALFTLYGLNVLIASLGVIIPINIITIVIVSILGIPGLCILVGLFLLI